MSAIFFIVDLFFELLGALNQVLPERQFDRAIAVLLHLFAASFIGIYVGWVVAQFTNDFLGTAGGVLGGLIYAFGVGYLIFRRKRKRRT